MPKSSDCGFLIKQILDCMEKYANNDLRESNLTLMQNRVIMSLHMSSNNTKTLKELEKEFNVSQPTMVGIIHRLSEKGYVKTFRDANDKRIKHVQLTGSGIDCSNDAHMHVEKMEAKLLSNLSEEEQTQLKQLLLKVLNTIK